MTDLTPRVFSLDDVLARNIPIHWDEAVAVVEELCAVLTEGGSERAVPDFGDILITGDGTVTLRGRAGGTKGASGVGRTLHRLLSTGDVPVALRLFVTQATSLNTYASLTECATALAYFGKPGRAELIRAVYARCAAAGATASAATPARERLPVPEPAKPQTDKSARRRAIPPWVVVAASAACVFGAAMLIWSAATGNRAVTGTVPVLAAQTKNALQQLGTGVRNALSVAAAPAKLAEPDKPTSTSKQAAPSPVTRTRRDRRTVAAATREPVQVTLPFEALHGGTVLPEGSSGAADVADTLVAIEAVTPARATEEERLAQIYTRADLDVRPPLLVYPQLPPQLVAENRAGMVNTMEIVVSESGDVMQVRLIDGPRRMPDMMLLSGAKMWRFRPAVKDGDPVRYRTVVSWVAGP